jgi:hypothetical protein
MAHAAIVGIDHGTAPEPAALAVAHGARNFERAAAALGAVLRKLAALPVASTS